MRRYALATLAIVCAVALSACGGTVQPSLRERSDTTRRPVAVVLIQSSKVPLSDGPAPSLLSIVGLERGDVTTITIPPAYPGGTSVALSPDGRKLLYPADTEYPALRVLDLESRADAEVIMPFPPIEPAPAPGGTHPILLASGWSTNGEVVALTATRHSNGSAGPAPGTDYLSDFRVWHGPPGRMAAETVTAESRGPLDGAVQRLLVADTKSAWFAGWFAERGQFPNEQRLLRYDFGSHALATVSSLPNAIQIGGVGSKGRFFLLPPFSDSPTAQSLLAHGVPVANTETHTRNAPAREYFRTLQGVDLRRLSDFQPLGSIPVTSGASTGNYVHENEWGLPLPVLPKDTAGLPVGLPLTGDWGLPVFDPAYRHYMRSRAVTGGAEVSEWDVGSGKATALVGEPDPLAMPLGYINISGSALFTASAPTSASKGRTLALFLYEPGKGSRVVAHLPAVPADRFPTYHPTLLGVQHAK